MPLPKLTATQGEVAVALISAARDGSLASVLAYAGERISQEIEQESVSSEYAYLASQMARALDCLTVVHP